MFLATSEIAVAMRVCSVVDSPLAAASSRPFWRAVTMSPSCSMGTDVSWAMAAAPWQPLTHEGEALLEVERGRHALQRQAELDHGEGDVGLDAHHDRLRAAQPRRVGDAPDGAGGERVQDVERRHVDDDCPGPGASYRLRQVVPQLDERVVAERRLHGGDEDLALPQDRDGHVRLHHAPARAPN